MQHYNFIRYEMHPAFFDAYYWWNFPDYDHKTIDADTVGLYLAGGEL